MSGGGGSGPSWSHDVRLSEKNQITVDDGITSVRLTQDRVRVGCTMVTREVIEYLADEFKRHFPKNDSREVKLQ